MKKYGTVIALGLAVLFGVLAVVLVNRWMTARVRAPQEETRSQMALTKIVVAAANLNIGTRLSADNLALAEWPKANVPQGAFSEISQVEGRVVVSKMIAGTPIRAAELAAPGSGAGLVATIKPGMRAMAIRVDEVVGVGGFIMPNTFVDVIEIDNQSPTSRARTILEKVEVLAIAQETYNEDGKPKIVRTVTLELSPQDAEKMAQTTHKGAIQLVLRNPLDEVVEPPAPAPRVVERRPAPRPAVARPRPAAPAPSSFEVEVIRGEKPAESYRFQSK